MMRDYRSHAVQELCRRVLIEIKYTEITEQLKQMGFFR